MISAEAEARRRGDPLIGLVPEPGNGSANLGGRSVCACDCSLKGGVIEAYSAGLEKHEMNPHAAKVMAEAGVDLSKHYSMTLEDLKGLAFDYAVTVCGHAHEHCPIFPGKTRVVHVGFEDPPKLTEHLPDGEEKLAVYRRVRDEIRRFVETLPESLPKP